MVRIVVVGGGSAGWTTASYIKNSIDCELTVIHEEQNNPIGVGETVTPTLRLIAENANIPENVWLKDSDATFKYGIKFNDHPDEVPGMFSTMIPMEGAIDAFEKLSD